MTTTIIGIDCATQPKKVGLALGHFHKGLGRIERVLPGGALEKSVAETIAGWLIPPGPTLLALDSPLGWPEELGEALFAHEAGQFLAGQANTLFRRLTDRVVKQETGKQSLDVGADRIARTAHWTLGLLQELRARTGKNISLAWTSALQAHPSAIEVYPAATLVSYGVDSSGYKKKEGIAARRKIVSFLQQQLDLSDEAIPWMEQDDNALDAALCVLAGLDFLRDQVIRPTDPAVARKEGWIWVKPP